MPFTQKQMRRQWTKKRRRKKVSSCLAIDTETTGLNLHHSDRAFAVILFDESAKSHYFEWPVDPFTREVQYVQKDLKKITQIIDSYDEWIFHNTKLDVRALIKAGIDMEGLGWRERYHDTVLASHVMCSNEPHDLKWIGWKYFDISEDDEKALKETVKKARRAAKQMGWNCGPHSPSQSVVEQDYWLPSAINRHTDNYAGEPCKEYASTDGKRTMLAWMMYRDLLQQEKLYGAYLRERKLLPIVYDMEEQGVTIHNTKLVSEIKRYTKDAIVMEKKCVKIAKAKGFKEFNINSNTQVGKLLHTDKKGFKVPVEHWTDNEKNPQPSLDSKAAIPALLASTTGPALSFLQSFSSRKKTNTAVKYLTLYDTLKLAHRDSSKHFCLHPSFNQTGTGTTRFSCSNPNTQNIGKGEDDTEDEEGAFKLRSVFGPRPGRIWYCIDYAQLQLRIFAYASKQKSMIEAFKKGYDFHSFVASVIFNKPVSEITKNEKRVGKNVNFGFIFGAGPKKIELASGMPGLYKKVSKLFPNAHDFLRENIELAEADGYITTMGGYRLYVPRERTYAATCYKVQGTEGDIVKNGMIEVDDYLSSIPDHYLTMQVHDELVFDFPLTTKSRHPKYLREIVSRMTDAGTQLGVITPVNVEVCREHWADMEKISL